MEEKKYDPTMLIFLEFFQKTTIDICIFLGKTYAILLTVKLTVETVTRWLVRIKIYIVIDFFLNYLIHRWMLKSN